MDTTESKPTKSIVKTDVKILIGAFLVNLIFIIALLFLF